MRVASARQPKDGDSGAQALDVRSFDVKSRDLNWVNVPDLLRVGLTAAHNSVSKLTEEQKDFKKELQRVETTLQRANVRQNQQLEQLRGSMQDASAAIVRLSRRGGGRRKLQRRGQRRSESAGSQGQSSRRGSASPERRLSGDSQDPNPKDGMRHTCAGFLQRHSVAAKHSVSSDTREPSRATAVSSRTATPGKLAADVARARQLTEARGPHSGELKLLDLLSDSSSNDEEAEGFGMTEEEREKLSKASTSVERLESVCHDLQKGSAEAIRQAGELLERVSANDSSLRELQRKFANEYSKEAVMTQGWDMLLKHLPRWFKFIGAAEEATLEELRRFFVDTRGLSLKVAAMNEQVKLLFEDHPTTLQRLTDVEGRLADMANVRARADESTARRTRAKAAARWRWLRNLVFGGRRSIFWRLDERFRKADHRGSYFYGNAVPDYDVELDEEQGPQDDELSDGADDDGAAPQQERDENSTCASDPPSPVPARKAARVNTPKEKKFGPSFAAQARAARRAKPHAAEGPTRAQNVQFLESARSLFVGTVEFKEALQELVQRFDQSAVLAKEIYPQLRSLALRVQIQEARVAEYGERIQALEPQLKDWVSSEVTNLLSSIESLRVDTDSQFLGVRQTLQDVESNVKRASDLEPQLRTIVQDNVALMKEEAAHANEKLAKLFPAAYAYGVEHANFTLSEARMFTIDSRLNSMEKHNQELVAKLAELRIRVGRVDRSESPAPKPALKRHAAFAQAVEAAGEGVPPSQERYASPEGSHQAQQLPSNSSGNVRTVSMATAQLTAIQRGLIEMTKIRQGRDDRGGSTPRDRPQSGRTVAEQHRRALTGPGHAAGVGSPLLAALDSRHGYASNAGASSRGHVPRHLLQIKSVLP